jgi:peptidoglycan/LPS O-acetylase OafA/YrhL
MGQSHTERLHALDGLRFLAALAVLVTHYISAGWVYWHPPALPAFDPIQPVARWGWMGVNLFFIISGYAICMSSWGRGLGAFFASRVARLFPAYVVCALMTFAVTKTFAFRDVGVADLLVNLTMLHFAFGVPSVDGAYWTLWQELLFYLLFAIVIWRAVNYRRVLAFCLIWTVAAVFAVYSGVGFLQALLQRDHFMYFVAGVAMYLMRRHGPNLLLWGIIGVSALLAMNAQGSTLISYWGEENYLQHWAIGAGLILVCFGLVLVIALGWLDGVRWRPLVTAGAVTYPLYLLHSYIGWWVIYRFSATIDPWLLFGGLVVGMLVASYLVHRLVERPFAGRIRRRLEAAFRVGEGKTKALERPTPVVSAPPTVPVVSAPPTVPVVSAPPTVPGVSASPTVPVVPTPPAAPVVSAPPTVPVVSAPPTATDVTVVIPPAPALPTWAPTATSPPTGATAGPAMTTGIPGSDVGVGTDVPAPGETSWPGGRGGGRHRREPD